ncbi:MAG TPA: HEAT repeat domain-containing protein, partial [Pyrinomonadaceae bacterium]|nr:HEAT repeat domain-containing protein [Pyrinomonadaceae bacterium]
ASDTSGAQVVDRLVQTIRPAGISAVLEALGKASTSADNEVIKVAGWLPDSRAVERLGALLDEESLREPASAALVRQGDAAIPILIEKLDSEELDVRVHAAQALGSIGTEPCVDALIAASRSDSSVALSALEALGRSTNPKAFDALIELLASPDKTLRRAAVNTLKRFPRENAFARLEGLLADVDPNVRESAIRVIGDLEGPACREAVLAATEDADETVRVAAVEQLASFPSDAAVKVLARALGDKVSNVRAAAARTLAAFADNQSVQALGQALKNDSDPWVRYFAIRSLSENGGASRFSGLLKDLAEQDSAEQVRVAAAEAITGATD